MPTTTKNAFVTLYCNIWTATPKNTSITVDNFATILCTTVTYLPA